MKNKVLLTAAVLSGYALFAGTSQADAAVEMHRLYNPNSGEHFYTGNTSEKNNLVKSGWQDEGIGWVAPDQGNPVYRLYNANAGDHHYTMNRSEKSSLEKAGWKDEGIGWNSSTVKEVALYRTYNPNAKAGSHHYTTSSSEHHNLIKSGWKDEGIAWYGTVVENSGSVPPRKVDEDITTIGGGEGDIPGSYRLLYSNRPFDDMPNIDGQPFIEFSADMSLHGTKDAKDFYGMQFVIAGNGEGSGQIGLDIGYQAGPSIEFAQNRISVKTVNFPAESGITGQQFYSINTDIQMTQDQLVKITVQYHKTSNGEFVVTKLDNQIVGIYKTKLTTPNQYILHAQVEDWQDKGASTKLTNIKIIKDGKDVTTKGDTNLHVIGKPHTANTEFILKAGTEWWLVHGAY